MSDSGRVLVAEAGDVSRRVATAVLEHLGCQATAVADGAAAIREASREEFELVLMGLELPVVGGAEAAARIHGLDQGSQTTILAVTAAGDAVNFMGGFDGILTRPLTLASLAEALRRWTGVVPPDRPALDGPAVAAIRQIGANAGQDLWTQLVEIFLGNAGSWLPAMRAASSPVDPQELYRLAHTLGGSSANLGASHLAALCSTLTAERVTHDPSGTSDAIDAVKIELERVTAALRSSIA